MVEISAQVDGAFIGRFISNHDICLIGSHFLVTPLLPNCPIIKVTDCYARPLDGAPEQLHNNMTVFTHFALQYSNEKLLLADLEGE